MMWPVTLLLLQGVDVGANSFDIAKIMDLEALVERNAGKVARIPVIGDTTFTFDDFKDIEGYCADVEYLSKVVGIKYVHMMKNNRNSEFSQLLSILADITGSSLDELEEEIKSGKGIKVNVTDLVDGADDFSKMN